MNVTVGVHLAIKRAIVLHERALRTGHGVEWAILANQLIQSVDTELRRLPGYFGAWTKLVDEKPPSGIYLFYHPGGKHTDGCTYGDSIDRAFWDADDGVARGDYHGPFPATHWMPQPGVPT